MALQPFFVRQGKGMERQQAEFGSNGAGAFKNNNNNLDGRSRLHRITQAVGRAVGKANAVSGGLAVKEGEQEKRQARRRGSAGEQQEAMR